MYRYVCCIAVLLVSISLCIYGYAVAQDDILAKFGDKKITIADLDKVIGFLDAQKQQMIKQNPQLKEQLLRQLVQSYVIADLAKKAGYEKDADIAEQLEFFKDSFLANVYVKREIIDKIQISNDDIKAYYKEHEDELKTPEMVQARHILFRVADNASEEEKQKIFKKAEEILDKIKSGEDFAQLASEFSDDTVTKTNGGDLGVFARGRMVKSFEDAAFALKPGEVSGIVETPFGYHIIKVEEKIDASVTPYDSVKESIKQRLIQERTQSEISEFAEKALKDAEVEFHTELLTGGKKEEKESE
jgi:peptidyl-prolyl cis-trans isomerase C